MLIDADDGQDSAIGSHGRARTRVVEVDIREVVPKLSYDLIERPLFPVPKHEAELYREACNDLFQRLTKGGFLLLGREVDNCARSDTPELISLCHLSCAFLD